MRTGSELNLSAGSFHLSRKMRYIKNPKIPNWSTMAKVTKAATLKAISKCAGIVSTVAKKLRVDWHTAKKYIEEWEETRIAFQSEKEGVTDLAESELIKAIKAGESWAVKYYLSTIGKERGYTEKLEQDITSGGKPIQGKSNPFDVLSLPIEKRKAILEIIENGKENE